MFCPFLMEVSPNVIAEYGSNTDVHMLIDNAPSHRNLDDSLYSHTLPMRRIPKYSPMLNPIECAFSSRKAEPKNLYLPTKISSSIQMAMEEGKLLYLHFNLTS